MAGGLFRADGGFYEKKIEALFKARKISRIIRARLKQAPQQAIVDQGKWQQIEFGLEDTFIEMTIRLLMRVAFAAAKR